MTETRTISTGKDGSMRVAVLFSGGASGAKYLFQEENPEEKGYQIVAGIADSKDVRGTEVFTRREVPVKVADREELSPASDSSADEGSPYFERLARVLKSFNPDLILLSGFMQVVKDPLLSQYEGRIINVHPADLRLEEDGERKYRGADPVYDAILAGEQEVRSTVHLVTKEVDRGAILVVSEPLPVERKMVRTFERFNPEMVEQYANLLQEWMKWCCDGPSIHAALSIIASGKVGFTEGKVVFKGSGGFREGYYDLREGKIVGPNRGRS